MSDENAGTASAARGSRNEADGSELAQLSLLLLQSRRMILGCALGVAMLNAAYLLLSPRTFTVVSSFIPEYRRSSAGLSGIAAQLGIATQAGEGPQGPPFYVDLVRSHRILYGLAASTFRVKDGDRVVERELSEILIGGNKSLESRREDTVRRLRKLVTSVMGTRTGVVTISVTAPAPEVARQMSERIIELINLFNLQSRQSLATAERKFTEQRRNDVGAELRRAEDKVQRFLQENRGDLTRAPALQFEYQRLIRDVTVQGQVYASLTQSYEQARLEEVRDTPIISVVEPATTPYRPDPRGVPLLTLLAFAIGAALAVLALITRQVFLYSMRQDPRVAEDLRSISREVSEEILGTIRRKSRV